MPSSNPPRSYSVSITMEGLNKHTVRVSATETDLGGSSTLTQDFTTDMLFPKVQEIANNLLRQKCQHIQRELAKLQQ